MDKSKAHSMRDDLAVAAHAMGLNELIVAVTPRLVTSALGFIASMYAVMVLLAVVLGG